MSITTYGEARQAADKAINATAAALAEIDSERTRIGKDRMALLHTSDSLVMRLADEWFDLIGKEVNPTTVRAMNAHLGSKEMEEAIKSYETTLVAKERTIGTSRATLAGAERQLANFGYNAETTTSRLRELNGKRLSFESDGAFLELYGDHQRSDFKEVDMGPPSFLALCLLFFPLFLFIPYFVWSSRRKSHAAALTEAREAFGGTGNELLPYFATYEQTEAEIARLEAQQRAWVKQSECVRDLKLTLDSQERGFAEYKASFPQTIRTLLRSVFREKRPFDTDRYLVSRKMVVKWPLAVRATGLQLAVAREQIADLDKLLAPLQTQYSQLTAYSGKVRTVQQKWRRKRDFERTKNGKDFAPWLIDQPAAMRRRTTAMCGKIHRVHGYYSHRGYDDPRQDLVNTILDCTEAVLDTLGPDVVVDTLQESAQIAEDVGRGALNALEDAGEVAMSTAQRSLDSLLEMPIANEAFQGLEDLSHQAGKLIEDYFPDADLPEGEKSEGGVGDALAAAAGDDEGPHDGPDDDRDNKDDDNDHDSSNDHDDSDDDDDDHDDGS